MPCLLLLGVFCNLLLVLLVSHEHSKVFLLFYFTQHAFDHNKARNEGVILPKPGMLWCGSTIACALASIEGTMCAQSYEAEGTSPLHTLQTYQFRVIDMQCVQRAMQL